MLTTGHHSRGHTFLFEGRRNMKTRMFFILAILMMVAAMTACSTDSGSGTLADEEDDGYGDDCDKNNPPPSDDDDYPDQHGDSVGTIYYDCAFDYCTLTFASDIDIDIAGVDLGATHHSALYPIDYQWDVQVNRGVTSGGYVWMDIPAGFDFVCIFASDGKYHNLSKWTIPSPLKWYGYDEMFDLNGDPFGYFLHVPLWNK